MVCNSCLYRRRRLDRHVNPAEIVVQEVDYQVIFVVLPLLAVGVGQPGHATEGHTDRQVVALDVACTGKVRIGMAAN